MFIRYIYIYMYNQKYTYICVRMYVLMCVSHVYRIFLSQTTESPMLGMTPQDSCAWTLVDYEHPKLGPFVTNDGHITAVPKVGWDVSRRSKKTRDRAREKLEDSQYCGCGNSHLNLYEKSRVEMSREQPQRFSGLRLDELPRNLTIPFFCWSNPPLPCWLIAHTCWIPAVHYSPFKQPNIEGNIITTRYIITIRWHHI